MKEYKYTINGNKYEVVVGDIKDNIATLTVNGETYTVEMEKQPEPEKKKPVVKAATPDHRHSCCRRRRGQGWRYGCRTRGHEDG